MGTSEPRARIQLWGDSRTFWPKILIPVLAAGSGLGSLAVRDAFSAGTPAPRPNVVVLLLDAVRADHLGCYGHGRDTSPTLDALAKQAVLFEHAMAQASWTKPSVPSLLTGLYPIQHRVFTGNTRDTAGHITSDVLPEDILTLAEALRAAGYATGAFVENTQISSFMGFAQGFDVYHEDVGEAEKLTASFSQWLDQEPRRPFFAYVHFLDPHWPYTPPEPFHEFAPAKTGSVDFNQVNWKVLQRRIRSGEITLSPEDLEAMGSLYDGEIRYTDSAIAGLLESLRTGGLFENTILLVTADHGEEFLEHGNIGHGESLYQEVLHVPLILRIPGAEPRRVADQVELVDVMPTLLDLLGIEPPASLGGRSLRPLIEGKTAQPVAAFADFRPHGVGGRIVQSVCDGRYKLIRTFDGESLNGPESLGHEWRPPKIEVGQWLEVEGVLEEDGSFLAVEVELLEGQEETRISGRIQDLGEKSESFQLLGLPCRLIPGAKLRDSADRRVNIVDLKVGSGVRVKGERAKDGVFKVRSLKLLPESEVGKQEIKALVEDVQAPAEEVLLLQMTGLQVEIDSDTEFDGAWPAWESSRSAAVASAEPREPADPAASGSSEARATPLERVLERVLVDTELYDLSADPLETVDLSVERLDLVEELTARLDAWEMKYETHSRTAQSRITLDPETLERLKSLGYIR